MKNMRRTLLMATLMLGNLAFGQDIKNIMRAGAEDGETYFKDYMAPAMISLNNGLASGWYNTAKTHKLLGIDLTVSANFATIPNEDMTFLFDEANFEVLELQQSGSTATLPTIGGGDTDVGLVIRSGSSVGGLVYDQDIEFTAASGVGDVPFKAIPTPTITLGVGLVKNTDVKVRYIPTVQTDNFSLELFGIGVMHDIKQWIPGLKLVPIDLAGFVGTTKMTSELTIETDDVNQDDFMVENGLARMTVSSTTVQVLISKKLSIFTPYAGLGYNITKSTFDVLGDYTYSNNTSSTTVTDPVQLEFSEGNTPRITVGGRLKLLVLTLHADYTIQKYNTFTAGVGISVR